MKEQIFEKETDQNIAKKKLDLLLNVLFHMTVVGMMSTVKLGLKKVPLSTNLFTCYVWFRLFYGSFFLLLANLIQTDFVEKMIYFINIE